MELEDYVADFNSAVVASAHADNNYTFSAFLEVASERLADAQEVRDLVPAHFEGYGSKNRRIQLDGVVVDEADGSLILLVGEHRTGVPAERLTTGDAKKLFGSAQAFVEDALSGRLADTLEESSEAFRTAMLVRRLLPTVTRIRFYLVTNTLMSDRIKDFPSSTFGTTPVSYHIWDIARFFQANVAVHGREDLVVDLRKWLPEGLPCLAGGPTREGFQTYLAVIPGKVLASIFSQFGSRLLEGNVRSFLSARVKVNQGIRATLSQSPHLFLAFNNGLTCTASSIELVEGAAPTITSLTDLQIVNGGQTTASIAAFAREVSDDNLDGVFVQMKLVVVDPIQYEELVPDIAKYANSQNTVSGADFFSNSPFHRRIEELSRRILAPAIEGSQQETFWFYERARGQFLNEKLKRSTVERRKFEAQNPRSQLLVKTDVAKVLQSWDRKPHEVSLGAQKNFTKFAVVADSQWSSRPLEINELYFKMLVAKSILFSATHKRISNQDWYETGGYLANLTTYSVAKLSEIVSQSGQSLDFGAIWSKQRVSDAVLEALDVISLAVQGVLLSNKRGTQNVSEWAKKAECWDQVKAIEVELSPKFYDELVGAAAAAEAKVDARAVQKLDDGIAAQAEILSVSIGVWKSIRESAVMKPLLSPQDHRVLDIVDGSKLGQIPERFQVTRLQAVLKKARDLGEVPR